MNQYFSWKAASRVSIATIIGGVFYACWLALFLLIRPSESSVEEILLMILAPPVTATGFASGVFIYNRFLSLDSPRFHKIIIWPLTGCILGALIVYRIGPMLLVFTMLLLGTIAMILREIVLTREQETE